MPPYLIRDCICRCCSIRWRPLPLTCLVLPLRGSILRALRWGALAPWPRHAMLLKVSTVTGAVRSLLAKAMAHQRLLELAQLAIALLLGPENLSKLLLKGREALREPTLLSRHRAYGLAY